MAANGEHAQLSIFDVNLLGADRTRWISGTDLPATMKHQGNRIPVAAGERSRITWQ